MRRRTASWGVSIKLSPEGGGADVPQPDGHKAAHIGTYHIPARTEPLTILDETKGLQAEGGKGGVAAADADHEKIPELGTHQQGPIRVGQCAEKADRERAGHVDDQRAP